MYVAASPIAGRGIFSSRPIPIGRLIATMTGRVRPKRYRTRTALRAGENWVAIGGGLWVDPKFPTRYMNHSCEPNAGFRTSRRLYALRNILPGEEITFDYSTVDPELWWSMSCRCGTSSCRALVQSIQLLPEHLYRQYLPHIPRSLRHARRRWGRAGVEHCLGAIPTLGG